VSSGVGVRAGWCDIWSLCNSFSSCVASSCCGCGSSLPGSGKHAHKGDDEADGSGEPHPSTCARRGLLFTPSSWLFGPKVKANESTGICGLPSSSLPAASELKSPSFLSTPASSFMTSTGACSAACLVLCLVLSCCGVGALVGAVETDDVGLSCNADRREEKGEANHERILAERYLRRSLIIPSVYVHHGPVITVGC
jgi:hypothetical protein